MCLETLPPELLLLIGESLPTSSVLSLLLTTRRLSILLTPLLFSLSLTHPPSEKSGDTPLHFSAKCNNLPLTSYLLSHLYPPSTPNNAKWTPLHLAALHDHVELARLLLLHGADVNVCFSTFESTPLHRAFSPAMASLLIEFGADVQAKNFLNQTPLHTACSLGLDGVVRVLLENGGGETVLYDCEYVTQLDLAVKSGSAGTVRVLLESKCGNQLLRRGGEDILRKAVKWGFAEVVKVLIEAGVEVEETYVRRRARRRWGMVRGGMLGFLRRG